MLRRQYQQLALNGTDHSERRQCLSCVLMITGPPVYMDTVEVAQRLGCAPKGRLPSSRLLRRGTHAPGCTCALATRETCTDVGVQCQLPLDCRNSGAAGLQHT